jgi:uncharacterized protein
MEELDQKTNNLPAVDQQWANAQAEHAQFQVDAKERLDRMTADQKVHQEKLVALEATLPPPVKAQYDRLVKSYGADSLAGVVGRVCQQCRNSMTEQIKVELNAGKFICCSRCGRGLYPLAEAVAASAEE